MTEDGRVLVETTASASLDTVIGISEFSRRLTAGPHFGYAVPFGGRDLQGRLALDVVRERRFRGSDGYTANLWAGLSPGQALDEDGRVGNAPRVRTTFQDGQPGEVDPVGRSLSLALLHRKLFREGYQPALMFDGSRTDSDIPLCDPKLLSFRLRLQWLF